MTERINPNVEKPYNMGDPVFFYDTKRKEWKRGTALVRLGKTLYLRFGNFLRRVPVEKVRPDYDGEVVQEEGYAENDDEEIKFTEEETPVQEMATDLNLSEANKELQKQLAACEEKIAKQAVELDDKTNKEHNADAIENAILD